MTVAKDLQQGVAELLAAAGVGSWQESGVYPAGASRPIFVRAMPASPDRLIVVSHYPVSQQPWTSDTVEGIQVRIRGPVDDPRPADDDADAVRTALNDLEHVDIGGHHVNLVAWANGPVFGMDENRRWGGFLNFYLLTRRDRRNTSD